jgi:hypothetical protein
MDQITVSSAALTLRSDKPLTPAMLSALWEVSACLDEERVPPFVPNSVWLTIPTARLRGPAARQDNVWLRECLDRMTGLKISGQHRGDEWGAVLVAEWHLIEGGAKVRILVPPAGVHALRSSENFAKIETTAAHRLPPHARRLYALLADRKRQREPYGQWSMDNLRGLLGVDGKRAYDRWNNFRARVLDPAVEAINDFGTVRVKMTPIKSGRSIAAVRFDWHWKDPQEATEIVAENERHSAARKKDQADSAAPPMIEDTPQPTDALTWWNGLTDAEREAWKDRIGRTFEVAGKTYPRKDRDTAQTAHAEHLGRLK